MQLIAPLASGISTAPLGTATILQRGTATAAANWEDFEGAVPRVTGTPVALGSYGEAEVYVNELVDVVVRNASGVTVRLFTVGSAAPNTEIQSLSFTGAPYGGGSAAPGEPTTLQAVADLWLTQNGAIDWQVLVNGVSYTIAAAFAGAALGIVFNVKSSLYAGGAIGDGATNDAPAISATIAACAAAGGGFVWFPPGSYRCNAAVTVPDKVVLVGAGPGTSNILINQAIAAGFDLLTGTVGQAVTGLQFSHVSSSAFPLLRVSGTIANVTACDFVGTNTTVAMVSSNSGAAITLNLDRCRFYPANSRECVNTLSAVSLVNTKSVVTRCYFLAPVSNASQRLLRISGALVLGNIFDFNQVTGGTPVGIDGTNGGQAIGNRFLDAALSVVWYGIKVPETGAGFTYLEVGNEFGQGTDPLNGHAYDFTTTEALLMTRDSRWIEVTESTSSTITLFAKEFGRQRHINTSSATTALTVGTDAIVEHAMFDLIMTRYAAGSGNYQPSNASFSGLAVNVAVFSVNGFALRVMGGPQSGGSLRWQPFGTGVVSVG